MDRPPIQIRAQMSFGERYRQGLIVTTLLLVWHVASLFIAAAVPFRFGIWIFIAAPFLFVGVLIATVPIFSRWRAHRKTKSASGSLEI